MSKKRHIPLILWPFWFVWKLVLFILSITGRIIGAVLGLVLLVVGILLCLTVIGAIIGLPLALLGLMLMIRSVF